MTARVICGLEEPLAPNQQLNAVGDEPGTIILADFGVEGLCRYSFTWHSDGADRMAQAAGILAPFADHLQAGAQWLIGWKHRLEGDYRFRSLRLKRKLEAAGWDVFACEDLGLSLKSLALTDGAELTPPELEPVQSGWAILFGRQISSQRLAEAPFDSTLRTFALTFRLEPSRAFLTELARRKSGAAYPAKGPSGLPGLVIISPKPASDVITRLLSRGLIHDVLAAEQAPGVWL